jgi:hypothetical protein
VTLAAVVVAAVVTAAALGFYQSHTSQQRLRQVIHLGTAFISDVESAGRAIPGSKTARWSIAQAGLGYLDGLYRDSGADPAVKREIAAAYGRIGDELDPDAPPDFVPLSSSVARAWQAAGSIYAALAAGEGDAQRIQDENTARVWLERALAEWRKIEGREGFLPQLRTEMEAASAALAALTKGSPAP